MFAKVIYGDSDEMLINPNCYVKLIYEYIKVKADVPNEVEIDLCDSKGNLKKINEPPTWKNGLELLETGETYYLVSLYEKNGRLIPIPLIDSNTAIYETLLKKLDVNKSSIKNIKSSNCQIGTYGNRGSMTLDAIVITDVSNKKKKKKELKPIKSNKFPSFFDFPAKLDGQKSLIKGNSQDRKKVFNDVRQSKESKSNEPLLTARKNIWYFSTLGNHVKKL